jgi:GntR family transcriptional regulator / MocR family aminotransferase
MAKTRTSSSLELHIALDRADPSPLHRQLEQGLRDAVRSRRLAPDAILPSSRALAAQLGVSRGIVVEAYDQLVAEGYLDARPGGATTVANAAVATNPRPPRDAAPAIDIDLRPGRPDLDEFPRRAWLRSLRRALETAPSERFGYLDGHGVPELRAALAAYLDRARGTAIDPDDVIVTNGFGQGVAVIAAALGANGARRIAVEDPSLDDTQDVIRASGLELIGVPVDHSGLVVDALEDVAVDAVVVTAAHQYPTGAVLPPDRRAALIAWAARRSAVIIEDDYDAEFRFDRQPIGAIQGLDPERVVYAGSASKVLAPGLRLGWLAVPPGMATAVRQAKRTADQGSPAIDQLAFADFIERGELDHHLRRLRPIYRERRDALLDALERHLPDVRPVGASAGLHVLAWLPDDIDEQAALDAAARAGIGLTGVAAHRVVPLGPGGLILGYGRLRASAADAAVRRLAAALGEVRGGRTDPRQGGPEGG